MSTSFYVYGLFADGICFYIGKGKGKRITHHFMQYKNNRRLCNYLLYCKLKSLEQKQIIPEAKVLVTNLTEVQALQIEMQYIKQYGKKLQGGTLCNISDGGNQPPNSTELKIVKTKVEWEHIKHKQRETFKKTTYERNKDGIKLLQQMLAEGYMLDDIAIKLNKTRQTLRNWRRQYNIPMNYTGKEKVLKEHLHKYRQINRTKAPKTAKTYTIQEPDGNIITINKLIVYCKEKNIDYSNLRKFFTSKGYKILKVVEPISKSNFCNCSI